MRYTMQAGEKLWNGFQPNQVQCDKYNALSDKIENFLNNGINATQLIIERRQFIDVISGEA